MKSSTMEIQCGYSELIIYSSCPPLRVVVISGVSLAIMADRQKLLTFPSDQYGSNIMIDSGSPAQSSVAYQRFKSDHPGARTPETQSIHPATRYRLK